MHTVGQTLPFQPARRQRFSGDFLLPCRDAVLLDGASALAVTFPDAVAAPADKRIEKSPRHCDRGLLCWRGTMQPAVAACASEGRREEAERLRTELVATGLSQREIQEKLVARLQPLDGTRTRAWSTPDPWEAGRLFRTKADQEELRALASDEDEDDVEAEAAQRRIDCAKWRREERQALRAARRRAHELKAKQAGAEQAADKQPSLAVAESV